MTTYKFSKIIFWVVVLHVQQMNSNDKVWEDGIFTSAQKSCLMLAMFFDTFKKTIAAATRGSNYSFPHGILNLALKFLDFKDLIWAVLVTAQVQEAPACYVKTLLLVIDKIWKTSFKAPNSNKFKICA